MILTHWVSFTPVAKCPDQHFRQHWRFPGLSAVICRLRYRSSLGCSCLKSKPPHESPNEIGQLENVEEEEEGFSVLGSDIPWEDNVIWSTFALYMFCLHIPLSFGGLSFVANILHQKLLHPQTQVLSLVVIQMVELSLTIFLLRNTAKPHCKSINFLCANNGSRQGRNWVVGSALGFGCLVAFIFITSLVAHQLFASKAAHNSELENIIASGDVSRSGCFALYCVVAPILEEIVYRRFLLTSLASKMEWRNALIISSGVFAASHFSGEGFVQLFGIGCVLGACYSWSGNLASSVVVHSLYNALTLLLTLLS